MDVTRTERLLNLVIALLAARVPLPRSTIQQSVTGYDPDAKVAAFERMFERDKEELRAMGIPVATILDAHGEVQGYLIDSEEYAQTDIDLTVDELAVLSIAARVWDEAVLAPTAVTALRKIEALATTPEVSLEPRTIGSISAGDAALLPLMRAVRERKIVRFAYRKPGQDDSEERLVEPWTVRSMDGHWYLTGWDTARGAERVFRISRIAGQVTVTAQECATREHGRAPRALLTAVDADDLVEATLLIPDGTGAELRRLAASHPLEGDKWQVTAPRSELLRMLWRADPAVQLIAPSDAMADALEGVERLMDVHT